MIHHYQQLGVPTDASIDEIRKAYRTLARRYHPDVNSDPTASESFLQIAEAYRYILTERKIAQHWLNEYQLEAERLYEQQLVKNHRNRISTHPTMPLTIRLALDGLTWTVSLFFVIVPFLVFYQLSQKGLSGWPSLAFLPLVIGGVFSMYLSVRFRRGSVY